MDSVFSQFLTYAIDPDYLLSFHAPLWKENAHSGAGLIESYAGTSSRCKMGLVYSVIIRSFTAEHNITYALVTLAFSRKRYITRKEAEGPLHYQTASDDCHGDERVL